jgi:hypothetical protein
MSKYRRAAKIDSNQPEIVKALRQIPGVTVQLGHDDILLGYKGFTFWYEIKTTEKSVVKESQKKILSEYTGHYRIVSSVDQILDDIKKVTGHAGSRL